MREPRPCPPISPPRWSRSSTRAAPGDDAIALLLDTGGNDTYRVPVGATTSLNHFAAVAVDLGGNDTYGYDEHRVSRDGTRLPSDEWGRAGGCTQAQMAASMNG